MENYPPKAIEDTAQSRQMGFHLISLNFMFDSRDSQIPSDTDMSGTT